MNAKRILVTGATGQQGGAVARELLKQPGFRVRALTRDPTKPSAQALAQAGAELLQGDLDDVPSVKRALAGAYGCFSVQNFTESGYEEEVRQGKTLAEAAEGAGVRHFVYSSAVSADQATGLPHFESKAEIEHHVRQCDFSFTILRPAFFMQNWYSYVREPILHGTIPLPLRPDTRLQQVSVDDIGAFAAKAFQNSTQWHGRTLELAGDDLSMAEVAALLTRVLGRNVRYVQIPWEQFQQQAGDEMTRMYRWFEDVGYHIDIAALRLEHPALLSLESTLRKQEWSAADRPKQKAA